MPAMVTALTFVFWLLAAWLAGLVSFFAVQHLLGATFTLDLNLLRTAVDMSPLAVPAFVLSVPVALFLKRRMKPAPKTIVLAVSGMIAAVLPLPAVLFVISGSWVALQSGEPGWRFLFVDAMRSGVGLLLLAQYLTSGGVFGAGYGRASKRRGNVEPRT